MQYEIVRMQYDMRDLRRQRSNSGAVGSSEGETPWRHRWPTSHVTMVVICGPPFENEESQVVLVNEQDARGNGSRVGGDVNEQDRRRATPSGDRAPHSGIFPSVAILAQAILAVVRDARTSSSYLYRGFARPLRNERRGPIHPDRSSPQPPTSSIWFCWWGPSRWASAGRATPQARA